MAEKPILFSGPMVRAILAGQKTQTRRVMRLEPGGNGYGRLCRAGRYIEVGAYGPTWIPVGSGPRELCPRDVWVQYAAYQPGDILWVKETWKVEELTSGLDGILFQSDNAFIPIEDSAEAADRWMEARYIGKCGDRWKSPYFMPKWVSRLRLKVADVRVQRLQDISEEDALAEGTQEPSLCELGGMLAQAAWSERQVYQRLWDSINAKRGYSWASNPWVWAYTFRVPEVRR